MSLHDRYLRRTPFELAFPDPERAQRLATSAFEEAEARGVDPHHPEMFATLGSVGGFLAELKEDDAALETVLPYAALAFHAAHLARAGLPVYLLSTPAARALVAGRGAGASSEDEPGPPVTSGYLQLPQHLFWVEGGDGSVPESLDGVFWTVTPTRELHALLATGVRPDRPGVGVVPIPAAPLRDAGAWAVTDVRPSDQGSDFESSIPGAGLDTLYGIRTAGEALKLLARFFVRVTRDPGAATPTEPLPRAEAAVEAGAPTPSRLPFTRVT